VSSDFDRLLREAREGLPGPGEAATEIARSRALAAIRRRRPRFRVTAFVGAAIVIALGSGIGLGSLLAPSGTAAQGPAGLGFLPEPGWYVLQAGTDATPERPGVAIASNKPLSPEDGQSIVPYSTLLRLPPDGIVIVANFTGRIEHVARFFPVGYRRSAYPSHTLPLRFRHATPYIQFGGQIRPEEPLSQYQLRAEVRGYAVDLHFYFGTTQPSARLRKEAQRQLDRLVVRAGGPDEPARPRMVVASPAEPSTSSVSGVDRTFQCETRTHGGINEVEARAHAGYRVASRWAKLPYAIVTTGGAGGALSGNQAPPDTALAWITAGSPVADTTVDNDFYTFPVRGSGTLGIHRARCRASRARVALGKRGLRGGSMSPLGEERDCAAPRRVLLRVRASLRAEGGLQQRRSFLTSVVPNLEAELMVRTPSGKPLVYARALQSGETTLFTARGCIRD